MMEDNEVMVVCVLCFLLGMVVYGLVDWLIMQLVERDFERMQKEVRHD